MGNIFAITTAAEDINADAAGKATAIFTVTNTSTKPMRAMATARPLDNTEQGWLDIEGESERDFGAGGTQQFTVNFNRPSGGEGKFPFRLDVASAVNPDEQFTEGPKVTVKISAAPATPKKGFPLWIIIVIAAVLLLIVGGILFFVLRSTAPKETGNNNPPRTTPTPVPAASFEGTWTAKRAELVNLQKSEIRQNGNFISVKLTMCEFETGRAGEVVGTFNGEILADGTAEVKGTYTMRGNTGYLKVSLRSLAPDQILVRAAGYPGKTAPEGSPNFMMTQVQYK